VTSTLRASVGLPDPQAGYAIWMPRTALRFPILALLAACAVKGKRGIVEVEGREVRLVESSGRSSSLRSAAEQDVLRHLDDLGLEVEGRRFGRRIVVADWTVTDGGDGAAPYIGVLERWGSRWKVDDRGSGSTITLVPESLGLLSAQEGHLVLISGYVAGPMEVNVVRWRSLDD
jgi:hypothetical protein